MKNLQTLNPYLRKYAKPYLWGAFFVIASNFLSIFSIKYVKDAFDEMERFVKSDHSISSQFFMQLMALVGLYVGLNIVSGILKFYQRQTLIVGSRKIEFDLRTQIFKHYTFLPLDFYKENKIGDLMNRITEDAGNVRMYLGPGIMYIINLSSTALLTGFFMFYYDAYMAWAALLPLPILSIIIYWVTKTIYKKSMTVQQNQSALSSFIQDSFSGIRVIKSYAKEDFVEEKYNDLSNEYKKNNMSLALTNSLFFPAIAFIIGVNYVLILYAGGVRYSEGLISFGNIAAFFLYLQNLVWPFISLGWIASLIQKAEVSMQRINEFLQAKEEDFFEDSTNLNYFPSRKIEFKNVSYTYKNSGIQALKNVSFVLEGEQNLAIFGKTGSGKTTIALLILGLLVPDSGEIYINNQEISKIPLNQLRHNLGYIPQEAFLFSDTLENNIAFGVKDASLDKVRMFAKKADVDKNIIEFKDQYQTKVGERGVMLSGGQKQRVSIARALITEAPIILFDDALSAVDTETEENILRNIEEEFNQKTSIIITHRVSSAKYANQILVLNEGRIKEQGTLENLMDLKGEFFELYQKQILEKELDI